MGLRGVNPERVRLSAYLRKETKMAITSAVMSTDEIFRGQNTDRILSDDLDNIENALDALDGGKAQTNHTHTVDDVGGLPETLDRFESAIAELQEGGGVGGVRPMLIASMHLGKLDNNSGAETTSSTRICSDPFAVAPNGTYWQVNDKGVPMYVLIYDADEVFVDFMGSVKSGDKITVTNANAAYMRLGSLIGEYDLKNEFRVYDADPNSSGNGSTTGGEGYTKEEADARFAGATHSHDGYAPATHKHTAADFTGLPPAGDGYSREEADAKFAPSDHQHNDYAPHIHSHSPASIGAADANHSHSGYAPSGHSHSGYAPTQHTHTAEEIGAFPEDGGWVNGPLIVSGVTTLHGKGYTQEIIPKDGGSYSIGNGDRRYYSTYLRVSPNVSSDRRKKRDICLVDVEELTDFVCKLPVVSYNYKDDAETDPAKIGLVAQDVLTANADIGDYFVERDEKGYYSLRPADLVFPLIAAVQTLAKRIDAMEK